MQDYQPALSPERMSGQPSSNKGLHPSNITQHHAPAQGVFLVFKQVRSIVSIALGVEEVSISEQVVKNRD